MRALQDRAARLFTVRCILALAPLLMLAVASSALAGDQQLWIQVDAQTRTYLLHLPPAHDGTRSLPVVIAFHGSRGDGRGMAAYTHLSDLADKENFIAVYPDGLVEPRSWNALFGKI